MRSLTRSFSKSKVSKEISSVSVQQLKEVKKDGFLWKRSPLNHWKKQFFVLTTVGIYTFASQNATQCKGLIRFTSYTSASPAHSETKKAFTFQIHYYPAIDAKHQSTVFLMAEHELDMNSWMDTIYSSLENAEKVTRQSYRFTPIADDTKPRKYRSLVINVAEAKELSIKLEDPSAGVMNARESPLATTSTSFNSSGLQSASSFNSPTTSAHSSYVLESRSNSVAELLVSNKSVLNCCTMIDIGQEQYRTRTARSKTPNPFWGEDFTIDLEEDVDFNGVSFTVWCEDKNHRPYIAGRVCMDEEQLIANQLMNQWVYLDYASTADFASGYITLRWSYGEPNLTVRVLEGRNLAMKSAHGAVYVEASYLAQVHKTQAIRETRNPFWNEELTLYSVPRALPKELRITCYDESLPPAAGFLGEFVIPVEKLSQSATKDVKYSLCHRVRASPNANYSRRSVFGSEFSRSALHSSIRLSTRSSSSPNLRQTMLAGASHSASAGNTPTFVSSVANAMINSSAGTSGARFPLAASPLVTSDLATPTCDSAGGSIRLSVRYLVENILSSGSYRQLHRLLTSHDGIQMSIALGSMVLGITERTQVSTSLVRAYDALGESTTLIIALTTHEILSTEDPRNFVGSKALDAYMRLIGGHFLHTTLSAFVTKLYEFGKSCELDPKALKLGKDVNRNIKRLQQITLDVLKAIYNSTEQCPSPLRTVFANLQKNVTHKFGDLRVRYLVVAGLLFSRLFCVALLSPKLFGLAQDHPDTKTERTLKLVVKIIQNIANLVLFEEKENYMKCMNPFIQEHLPLMKNFIDSVSKPTSYWIYTPSYNTTVINLDRESACIHAFLRAYKDELCQKYSQSSWIHSMTNILKELETFQHQTNLTNT